MYVLNFSLFSANHVLENISVADYHKKVEMAETIHHGGIKASGFSCFLKVCDPEKSPGVVLLAEVPQSVLMLRG